MMSMGYTFNPETKEDYLLEAQYAIWYQQYPYARRLLYLLAKNIDTPDNLLDHKEFAP